eukprot:TRINITY_DN8965_c0_g1_i4.p1 TRINITY_DN8965_c0_g1~~TRINITY_DN8965_c0_g1_i4.p1  ORF type:complete len:220 (+),score=77.55 TRINITY_DN8965_c0_g1_i4:39-662(+)
MGANICNGFGADGNAPTAEEIQQITQRFRQAREAAAKESDEKNDAAASANLENAMSGGTLNDPCMFNVWSVRRACIPAGNGHFTARAMAKFYGMLASQGEGNGVRCLSPERIEAMRSIRVEEVNTFAGGHIRWGRGFRVYSLSDGQQVSRQAFGHSGLGGSFAFCLPESRLSVAILVNKLRLERRATQEILDLICREIGVGQPLDFY